MRLTFRSVSGAKGAAYPAWVQALEGKSGVYAIKSAITGDVLYVGESHSGQLKKTLVRHFERWERDRSNRKADHAWSRHTGQTYGRSYVTVWALVTRKDQAVKIQFQLIQKLQPRDNEIDGSGAVGDLSDVPF